MGLFDILRPERLHIAWTYATSGVIWRALPGPGETLVGEERDLDRKLVLFFCVDRKNGSVLWEKRGFDETWWIGIAGMCSDTLFLHSYATPELPELKSITAVDLKTGKHLWANREMHFLSANDSALIAYRDTLFGREHCELDPRTGEVRKTLQPGDIEENIPEKEVETRFPEPLEDTSIIDGYCDLLKIEGPVGAIHVGDLLIFNILERSGVQRAAHEGVNNTLKVADRKRDRILFDDLLMSNAPAIAPESFFVQSDTLFYVKERNILTAVHLERRMRDHQTGT